MIIRLQKTTIMRDLYDGPSVNEKIYLNIFSPLYFVGRKYIQIYFLPPKNGGENISKYIFSQQNTEVKIYLNIFSHSHLVHRRFR